MKKTIILLILTVNILYSAQSFVDGYTAKEYTDAKLEQVLVYYSDKSFATERYFEEGFVEYLNKLTTVKADIFLNEFSPIYPVTDEQITEHLLRKGYQHIIKISKQKDNTSSSIQMSGAFFARQYTLADINMKIEIIELKTQSLMWLGDISIIGTSDTKDIREHLRRHIINLLIKDDLLTKK